MKSVIGIPAEIRARVMQFMHVARSDPSDCSTCTMMSMDDRGKRWVCIIGVNVEDIKFAWSRSCLNIVSSVFDKNLVWRMGGRGKIHLSLRPLFLRGFEPANGAMTIWTLTVARSWIVSRRLLASLGPKTEADTDVKPWLNEEEPSEVELQYGREGSGTQEANQQKMKRQPQKDPFRKTEVHKGDGHRL